MDVVLFGELLRQRPPEGVEVCEGVLGDLGTGSAAEEECLFRVLDGLGSLLVQSSFGARIARFSLDRMSAMG